MSRLFGRTFKFLYISSHVGLDYKSFVNQSAFHRFYSSIVQFNRPSLLTRKMPKENIAARQMREQRVQDKIRSEHFRQTSPGAISVHILGNGGPGNPQCVFLSTDYVSYMFNCGEGSQRLAHEHRTKLSKLENIFLTRPSWDVYGGLLGCILTVQDIGVPVLTIHGPPGLGEIYNRTTGIARSFAHFNILEAKSRPVTEGPYQDESLRVTPVVIGNISESASLAHLDKRIKLNGTDTTGCDGDALKMANADPQKYPPFAISYIVKINDKPGALDVMKCKAAGVPPGPLFAQLKAGNTITTPKGNVVSPEDVLGPPTPGPTIMLLDCPSIEHIDHLINSELIQSHISSHDALVPICIHMSSIDVITHPKYQDFVINKFNKETIHLGVNQSAPSLSHLASLRYQTLLNLTDPQEIFMPKMNPEVEQVVQIQDMHTKLGPIKLADTMIGYRVWPVKQAGLLEDDVVKYTPDQWIEEAAISEENMGQLKKSFDSLKRDLMPQICDRPEVPEVVFFGTGSAVPSKGRNTSCIWVNVDNDTSIIMDCGEGSYGQFVRYWSTWHKLEAMLKKLKMIYISHLHCDHHNGLPKILLERSKLTDEKVFILCPTPVADWLEAFDKSIEPLSHLYNWIPTYAFRHDMDRPLATSESQHIQAMLDAAQLKSLTCIPVKHVRQAFAAIFDTKAGQRVVYSGDCLPCDDLARRLQTTGGCDILIHEATMEDDLAEEAVIKCHCTTSQALDIARRSGARATILTHFSQRYSKVPIMDETLLADQCVGIAFDNMRVSMKNVPLLPHLIPLIKEVFQEETARLEAHRTKKQLKKEVIKRYLVN